MRTAGTRSRSLWAIRGWVDKLIGGVGLRRGRRDPDTLHVGDAVDFWRVEAIDRGSFLRLRAEMRVPGRAWLELRCRRRQRAAARATASVRCSSRRGSSGRLYWWAILPFHGFIFSGMANRITAEAEAESAKTAHEGEVTKR